MPTTERLRYTGGDALRLDSQMDFPVEMAGETIVATFNVINTGKHNLGFLFRMDLLERNEINIRDLKCPADSDYEKYSDDSDSSSEDDEPLSKIAKRLVNQ